MKKNTMMRIASFLLIAVLITTCGISGTYAKYVTADNAGDSARVAKWGVTVDVASTAFSDAYADFGNGNTAVTYVDTEKDTTITVQADSKGTKVLAPGTKGTLATVALAGTPEVDVQVDFEITKFNFEGWRDKDNKFYCPIIITVGTTKINGLSFTSPSAFRDKIMETVADYSARYDTNTDLSGVTGAALNISWEWPISTSAENDIRDTFLGGAAAGVNGGVAATIEFDLAVSVTQID